MGELIDREPLLKKWGNGCGREDDCHGDCSECAFPGAVDDVKTAPTIDAVPVVRCKECDNWATEFSSGRKSLGNYRCLCQEWSDAEDHRFTYTGENEYCSRGERREE